MATKSTKKEKQLRLKLVNQSLKIIETWSPLIIQGKAIVQEILQERENQDFNVNLQNACENLNGIVKELRKIVEILESNQEKLTNLQDLSNLSLDVSQSFNIVTDDTEIIDNHDSVTKCLHNQMRICSSIAENIAHKVNNSEYYNLFLILYTFIFVYFRTLIRLCS